MVGQPAFWGKGHLELRLPMPAPSGGNKGAKKGSRSEGQPLQKWDRVYGTGAQSTQPGMGQSLWQ